MLTYFVNDEVELYRKNNNKYEALGIEKSDLARVYNEHGEEGLKKLDENVNQLSKDTFLYSLKKTFYTFRLLNYSKKISRQFSSLISKYNVQNIDELLIFNQEVGSFLLDLDGLDESEISVIEKSRNNFRNRIGADSSFILSKKEALQLQNRINKIYNNHAYKEILRITNFRDFLEMQGYELNSKNLDRLLYLYFDMFGNIGSCSKFAFGMESKHLCLFNAKDLLNSNGEEQNNVILHEYIHCLDDYDETSIVKPFSIDFQYLNEALTEYLSVKALKYLKGNILSSSKKSFVKSTESSYVCMFPLVEKLRASSIWNDILVAKLAGNDIDYIERRIGYNNLKNIGKCFDKTYKNRNDSKIREENLVKLDGILQKLQKKR